MAASDDEEKKLTTYKIQIDLTKINEKILSEKDSANQQYFDALLFNDIGFLNNINNIIILIQKTKEETAKQEMALYENEQELIKLNRSIQQAISEGLKNLLLNDDTFYRLMKIYDKNCEIIKNLKNNIGMLSIAIEKLNTEIANENESLEKLAVNIKLSLLKCLNVNRIPTNYKVVVDAPELSEGVLIFNQEKVKELIHELLVRFEKKQEKNENFNYLNEKLEVVKLFVENELENYGYKVKDRSSIIEKAAIEIEKVVNEFGGTNVTKEMIEYEEKYANKIKLECVKKELQTEIERLNALVNMKEIENDQIKPALKREKTDYATLANMLSVDSINNVNLEDKSKICKSGAPTVEDVENHNKPKFR